MVALDRDRQTIGLLPDRLVLLAILVGSAIVSALAICLLLAVCFGSLPDWAWYGVVGAETTAAVFLGGALSAGEGAPSELTEQGH
jgi:hypothetical protein